MIKLFLIGILGIIISCGSNTSTPAPNGEVVIPTKPKYSRHEFSERPRIIVTPNFELSNLNRMRYEFTEPDFFITKRFLYQPDKSRKLNLGYVQTKVDGCKESGQLEVMYSWLKIIDENSNTFETVDQESWYQVEKDSNYQFVVSLTNNGRCKKVWLDFWMTSDSN